MKFDFKIEEHVLENVALGEIYSFMRENYNDYHWGIIAHGGPKGWGPDNFEINDEYRMPIYKKSSWGFKLPDFSKAKSYYIKRIK